MRLRLQPGESAGNPSPLTGVQRPTTCHSDALLHAAKCMVLNTRRHRNVSFTSFCQPTQISQTRGQELQRVASTAESLTAQAPSPGMVPAAEASAAGSLASLATQV